ncbi:MAG: hypothetical protein KC900_07700 [Candidatus Omnitrophica bacterium]|nr:hypothetical protein [Candidatus Omnitrophota bacterium]
MIRQLTMLLTLAAVLSATAVHALEVNVTDARLHRGEQASVTINFRENTLADVFAVDLAFTFDAGAFRLDRIEKGGSVSQFQLVESREDGPDVVKIALIGLFPLNAESGDLLTLYFTALEDGVSDRDRTLTVTGVTFATDEAALDSEKIRQGELILSR